MPPRIPNPILSLPKHCRLYSSSSASSERVQLTFDLHAPAKPIHNAPGAGAIIFMHGLFGSKKNNRSMSKQLARDLGRPVYAVDLRNHGDSPHHPRHDYMAMAEDVEAFIAEHNLSGTTLIGHSMGAKTAMTLALKSPSLITNLIPVDNAPLDAALLSSFGTYVRGMKALEASTITKQSDALSFLEPYESSLVIRQFLLGNLYRPPGESSYKFKVPLRILGEALDNLGDFPYKDPESRRFEKETLFVRGTQSKYVPDEAIPVIGKFFPRFRMVDVDCGHWVTSEKPEEFRQAVVEFLKPKE